VIVIRASLINGRVVQSASAVSLHRAAAADAAPARRTTQRNTVYGILLLPASSVQTLPYQL